MARLFLSLLFFILFYSGSPVSAEEQETAVSQDGRFKEIKPGDLVLNIYKNFPGTPSVINLDDSSGSVTKNCGNGRVGPGENYFNCPQDCGVHIGESGSFVLPSDLVLKYPTGIGQRNVFPRKDSRDGEREFAVNKEEMLALVVSPLKTKDCNCPDPRIEIWGCVGEGQYFLGQKFTVAQRIRKVILAGYTPRTEKIKIVKHGCFDLDVYSMAKIGVSPEPDKLTAYENDKYGFEISLVAGWRVKENIHNPDFLYHNPALVWQGLFYHDSYGAGIKGTTAVPAVEMSVEEFQDKKELSDAIYLSRTPCGVQLGGMCDKFSPCEFGYSQPFFIYQGGLGSFLSVVCNKGMDGMALVRGNRLYKFMFLTNSPEQRGFRFKQIEAMLNTLKFNDAGQSAIDREQISMNPSVERKNYHQPSEFESRMKRMGRITARTGREMTFYHPSANPEVYLALQTAIHRFRKNMENGVFGNVKYEYKSAGSCAENGASYFLEEFSLPSERNILLSVAVKDIDEEHKSVRFRVYNDKNLDALSDRFFAYVKDSLDHPGNNTDFTNNDDETQTLSTTP